MTNIENLARATPNLADTELIIFSSAANRTDYRALPIPDTLLVTPVDTQRVLKRLLKRRLLEEHPAKLEDSLWRKDRDDRHLTLRITSAGFDAINLEVPEDLRPTTALSERMTKTGRRKTEWKTTAKAKPKSESKPTKAKSSRKNAVKASTPTKSRSKTETVLRLLKQASGASLQEMTKATGWQAHSVRGFLSGVVKKRMRLSISATEDDKGVRRYHLKSRAKRSG